jgi:hypothetical protein
MAAPGQLFVNSIFIYGTRRNNCKVYPGRTCVCAHYCVESITTMSRQSHFVSGLKRPFCFLKGTKGGHDILNFYFNKIYYKEKYICNLTQKRMIKNK